jgi:hypothetical protein
MSAQTPQRIEKIPDREDLETEIRMLKALCEELKGALREAMDMIEGEYCSHGNAHSAENDACYAQPFYAALKKAEKDI